MQSIRHTLALVSLAILGTAAQAQVAGVYNGTTSAGGLAQVTVADDGNGGFLYQGSSFQWSMHCATGDSKDTWWGTGAGVEIVNRKASYELALPYLYEKISLKFSADGQTVTGTFIGSEPMYVDISVSKKVESCLGDKLTFSATLGAAAAGKPAFQALRMQHTN